VKRRKENVQEALQLWTPINRDRLPAKVAKSLTREVTPTSSPQRKLERRGEKGEWL
jgi:hypothetical protein